jgi:general secretion pathway protein D
VNITPSTGAQPPVRPAPGAKPGLPPQPQSAAPQPMSFTWQGPAAAKVGNRFTVTLNTQSGEPVGGLGVTINYDTSVLKAVDAVQGSFLRQGTPPPAFARDIDQGSGQIALDVTNAGGAGAKGAGSIAALTFEVVGAAAQAQISVSRIMPSGASGQPIDYQQPAPYNIALNP